MSPNRRKEMQNKRQRKMNRALEGILRTTDDPPYTLTEKIVTLKPQDDNDDIQFQPNASWQDSPFKNPTPPRSPELKDSFDELSREEQILELLQKVERQKRILLREFGANLPQDVFTQQKPPSIEKNHSPEIQVINMSTQQEIPKIIEKLKTKSEIAVQTSTIEETAEDKGVQVELIQEIENIENQPKIHPLEPIVKIVTPEIDDTSSGSSIITDLVINFDKKQVQVTPKRKKKGTLKISRKSSPLTSSKSRSVNKSTPIKKQFSKSPSKLPKKSPIKNQETKQQQFEIDTIDSSTESSQIYSTPKIDDSGKIYRIHSRSMKKTIRIRDASDTTSTSYASPPNAQAAALLNQNNFTDMTPILELLDSHAIDALHVRKSQISPVSTPETPSPRTIKLPSNIPNPEKISKMLKFIDIDNKKSQREENNFTKNSQKSMQTCQCKNPNCKMHYNETDNLKNCPEIQKLYEELENVCAERIASLTDLIKKLRNEPKSEYYFCFNFILKFL